MIVGAAVVPSAPLLVPGVPCPAAVAAVQRAARRAISGLPPHDLAVLLASGEAGGGRVHTAPVASLAGVGCPQLSRTPAMPHHVAVDVTAAVRYPLERGDVLPLGLSVLALLARDTPAVVAVSVPSAAADALEAAGAGIATALSARSCRAVVISSGDLSAALTPQSPRHTVDGAAAWDEAVTAVVDSGRLGALSRFGPQEARRVFAIGWAPLMALSGALATARVGLAVRHYAAPRGVGYLVAS